MSLPSYGLFLIYTYIALSSFVASASSWFIVANGHIYKIDVANLLKIGYRPLTFNSCIDAIEDADPYLKSILYHRGPSMVEDTKQIRKSCDLRRVAISSWHG